ncbi:MAG TPA: glycosyltransferase family 2 protein [Thermoanaerobaculia bacterium]|nr:glycosyltransferase family 2 protein [Thermoanaerobaculia bacterium]
MRISVVMAVYNGASELRATLDSILAQTCRDFEVIVVDDGSTDDTPSILAAYQGLRVITQQNSGLTRALVRGCMEARGDVIARHDNGDRSHPGRFAKQLAKIDEGHVLVACATRFVEPQGDTMYISTADGEDVRRSLTRDDATRIHALPAHGSAMFRRDAYLAAGGYRPPFRFAQDLDLWIRLAQRGSIAILDDVLYEATFAPSSISASNRAAQVRLTEIAVALRDGGDEAALLDEASRVAPARGGKQNEAAALYFIGKCLLRQRNPRGRDYLRQAVTRDPLHWRAWASILIGR